MKISLEHQKIIGDLANASEKNAEALIAYGADMYRQGLGAGFVCTALGVTAAVCVATVRMIKKHNKRAKENEKFVTEMKDYVAEVNKRSEGR